jgi:hypothetical protein
MTKQQEFWWSKYDWTVDFKIADPSDRAFMLADMLADDDAEREKYYDEILADIMSQRW